MRLLRRFWQWLQPCSECGERFGSKGHVMSGSDRVQRWPREAVPYVIENVPGARAAMRNPLVLTGEMFGLRTHRARLFEAPFLLSPPKPPRQANPVAVYGKQDGRRLWTRADGTELRVATLATGQAALGIDWMTWDELREAIPPAYTEWIGQRLMEILRRAA